MTSLNVIYLLMGAGIGLCIGYVLGLMRRDFAVIPKAKTKVESTVYFGRDDNDHPDGIERQLEGSAFVPAPGAGGYAGRGFDHRYDGIADRRAKG